MLLATGIVDPALGLRLFCLVPLCFNKNSTARVKEIENGIMVNLTFRFEKEFQGHCIKNS